MRAALLMIIVADWVAILMLNLLVLFVNLRAGAVLYSTVVHPVTASGMRCRSRTGIEMCDTHVFMKHVETSYSF